MSVIVNTNVASLIAQNNLSRNTASLQKAMQQISSGLRINSASDDAAGLSISESIKTQVNGNKKAVANIADGKNLLAVAEGGQVTVTNHLQRIYELCVQAANETYKDSDKDNIIKEIKQRVSDINNISKNTTFNGVKLLDGSKTNLYIQTGSSSDPTVNAINIGSALSDVQASILGVGFVASGTPTTDGTFKGIILDGTTTGSTWTTQMVRNYMEKVNSVIGDLTSKRAMLGAYGNRLDSTSQNLATMNENLEQTRSRITDADIAETSSDMIKYQILQKTSASILTQANQLPSLAMSLLGS